MKPEELGPGADNPGRERGWNRGDEGRKTESGRFRLPSIVVTTTTVIRFVDDGDSDSPCDGRPGKGGGAWMAADTWPGSDAPAGNMGKGVGAWVAADVWPGSDAPAGNTGKRAGAWSKQDTWPASDAPPGNVGKGSATEASKGAASPGKKKSTGSRKGRN